MSGFHLQLKHLGLGVVYESPVKGTLICIKFRENIEINTDVERATRPNQSVCSSRGSPLKETTTRIPGS